MSEKVDNNMKKLTKLQEERFSQLQKKLSLSFKNKNLLHKAFTHSSYVNEHRKKPYEDNERLEFLGDAVLELTVSEYLYEKHPLMNEGELTKLRATIVCEPSLFYFATELSFGDLVLLGKGEELTGGRTRQALLADVFEAFIGALYLDQGIEAVFRFLENFIFKKIDGGAFSHMMDFKSQLQEFVQKDGVSSISYEVLEEIGPAHNRQFKCKVSLNEVELGIGLGRSKKEAEQHAAQIALESLKNN